MPYEKGYCLIKYLEHAVGDPARFIEFAQAYVREFKFASIVSEDMFDSFLRFFPELEKQGLATAGGGLSFNEWLTTPGMPKFVPDLSAAETLSRPAEQLAESWLATGAAPTDGAATNFTDLSVYSQFHFVDTLVEAPAEQWGEQDRARDVLAKLDAAYQLSRSSNAEMNLRWSMLTIRHAYWDDLPNVRAFLLAQGKQKYQLPLYRALVKSAEGTAFAKEVFEVARPALHATVIGYITKILRDAVDGKKSSE